MGELDGSLLAVLLASLAGSLHCAGMCGPFVAVAGAAGGESAGAPIWRTQLLYALGRLFTYLVLGGFAGLAGHALDLAGEAVGLSRLAALAAAVVMVVGGAVGLLRHLGLWPRSLGRPRRGSRLAWRLSAAVARVRELPAAPRAFLVGLLTTWLPCGWLYAFVAVAAGTGNPWRAEAVMVAFWLGTVPALLSVGLAASFGGARLRRHAPLLLSVALLALGSWGLLRRAPTLLAEAPPAAGAAAAPSCHGGGS